MVTALKKIQTGRGRVLKIILVVGVVLLSHAAFAKLGQNPVDLDLQTSSLTYNRLLSAQLSLFSLTPDTAEEQKLKLILATGKRNLDWLIFMNQHLAIPLAFTQPGSLKGIPITAPKKYSGAIVGKQFDDFVARLPASMKAVLIDGQAFTNQPPLAAEEYTKLGNEMDKLYQTAARWRLMLPNLRHYELNKQYDIRGYYFLKNTIDLENVLRNYSTQTAELQGQIREWLQGECYNSLSLVVDCADEVRQASQNSRFPRSFRTSIAPFASSDSTRRTTASIPTGWEYREAARAGISR